MVAFKEFLPLSAQTSWTWRSKEKYNNKQHRNIHTFTHRQTGHNHTDRMQNTSATELPQYFVFYKLFQMLSMYKTNPRVCLWVLSDSQVLDGIKAPQCFSRTYKEGQLTWDSWGWELCCSWHSHTFDKPRKVFSVSQIPSFAHEGHSHGEQLWTMTHSWEGGGGTVAPWMK